MGDGDRDIATIEFTDKYVPDKALETLKCYGTSQIEHPGSLMVATERGKYYMGGKVTGLNLPIRDFVCATPKEVRSMLPADKDVVLSSAVTPSTALTTSFSPVPSMPLRSTRTPSSSSTPPADQPRPTTSQ